ncbi:EAL domain-containing protein [Nautilia sp.]
MNLEQIIKIFNNQPYVAVMVYKTKIIYSNKHFQKLLGYSEKEMLQLSPEKIFPPGNIRKKIKQIVDKRLRGEEFPATYEPFEVYNKKNERLLMKFFTQTIKLDDNSFAGLVLGIDVTSEIKKEFLIDILKDINQTIITKESEKEIYINIIKNIYVKGNYEFVCAMKKNNDKIEPKFFIGDYTKSFLDFLKTVFEKNQNFADNHDILVVNDTRNIANKEYVKNFLNKNIRSLLIVPIFKNNTVYSAIGIGSKYLNDFDETSVSIFKEAKQDIEFAIKKAENISYLKLLQEALDKAYSWVVITDENANILYVNKSVEEISGYKFIELLGKNPRIFKSDLHDKEFYKAIWNKLTNNKVVETTITNKDKNGNLFHLKNKIVPITAPDGNKYYISLAIDITQEKNLRNKLKRVLLTDLFNRQEFIKFVQNNIRCNNKYACIIIDLKDFKIFNQLNGNEKGDLALKSFSNLLKTIFYNEKIIARIGGDEFGVFIRYSSISELYSIINKIIYKIKNTEIFHNKLSVNIGIALYPKDSKNITELIEKAFLALEIAKEKGDFTYEFFNSSIKQKIIEYSDIKQLISSSIKDKKFIYHFQPYVNTQTLRIEGAETLLRIKNEDKLVFPGEFIDFAENSGMIKEIEKIMFPEFLTYVNELNIPLSFNISGKSLTDKRHIESLFDRLHNKSIIIELTEREIAGNIEYTKEIFNYFKSKNFKLSIDDFGTGYSSLTYLKNLPADFLKIDMSFIKNIANSKKDLAIVETIINFAHKFDLKTIAEGVENKTQVQILKDLNCDYLQGFYFFKPMEFNRLKKLLR